MVARLEVRGACGVVVKTYCVRHGSSGRRVRGSASRRGREEADVVAGSARSSWSRSTCGSTKASPKPTSASTGPSRSPPETTSARWSKSGVSPPSSRVATRAALRGRRHTRVAQQQGEEAVELVAVAAAPSPDDLVQQGSPVEPDRPAERDVEVLEGHGQQVREVQRREGRARRGVRGWRADAREVGSRLRVGQGGAFEGGGRSGSRAHAATSSAPEVKRGRAGAG